MAFVDEIVLHLKAGDGGNGIVSWLHEKGREFMGPAGGDGGRGGDVFIVAVRDIGRLAAYRFGNLFVAGRGGDGMRKSRHGKNGKDVMLEVPVGSVVVNRATGRAFEFLKEGERALVLRGGRGGLGNEHFKSSRNVRPVESTKGKRGEEAEFDVELRLIADAGLIGLPNAGKSSLLNELTAARAKVGQYAFTTLEPNLGDFHGFIFADIPGLIEGASAGKGLGTKFLRHIARTKLFIHCIPLDAPSPVKIYAMVRKELIAHAPELADKKEIIVLTKADTREPKDIKRTVALLKKENKHIFTVSIVDDILLKKFKEALLHLLKSTTAQQADAVCP
ncbi:MAG: GTPase ObgE [Patescibacteria group bacterium]